MTLSDRYVVDRGAVYLTGIQALVRLPLEQMRRDRKAGLRTAAFISGYEGSPLGGFDLALARVRPLLDEHGVHFVPAVNEELAGTAIFGSQILETLGTPKVDGVLGVWYGKGPGVDRAGDALRHANLAGAGRLGAALVLAGDDHVSKSSTIPHQSDFSLYNLAIPFFYPGNTQEILDYGLLAIALSRFSGTWVGLKLVTPVCDGGGTVEVGPERPPIVIPEGYEKHTDPRLVPPFSLRLEHEANVRRLEAAREFARVNGVNRWFGAREGARLGIAAAGKSYFDLAQALSDLGITADDLDGLGLRVAKFGMTFPLEPRFAQDFAGGLETLLVIEEKRSFLELQLREALYDLPARPRIVGKQVLPAAGELDPDLIARVVAPFLSRGQGRVALLEDIERRPRERLAPRFPVYCSGCPHNRSTVLEPGQVAGGGIGCHGMAMSLAGTDRGVAFLTQMGGEGAPWIGMAPFLDRQHIFQNVGDGTYFHSAALAVEAAVAAGVNITFKILYNRAVAMTGGQAAAGALEVPQLARKLEAEGVRRVVVVTDDPARYPGLPVRHRDELLEVQRELEQTPGVTAIIYDQQCAAEKRRLRSRGKLETPALRLVIHEEVCEGCGDCVRKSNCLSLQPAGDKMRLHQSSCNLDYSCLLGDCPSFVTVRLKPGTGLRRKLPPPELPEPVSPVLPRRFPYRILMPGVGGTGVVTVNALLAAAAAIDGLSVTTLDQTGLAQKGGAVVSHLVLSERPLEGSAKINAGNADLVLAFDAEGAARPDNLRCAHPQRTVMVLNAAEPAETLRAVAQRVIAVEATRLAEELFGTHLVINVFLLGVAWQAGLIPVTGASIEQAIQLNGVDVDLNLAAFRTGRAGSSPRATSVPLPSFEARLAAYQNEAYAATFREFVGKVAAREPRLTDAVARSLYKLMAYKDEYEVARLLTDPEFERGTRVAFEQVEAIGYNLHPPLLRALGLKKKIHFGPWFRPVLRGLARLRFLRGTPFDPFGYTAVRREERALVGWYRSAVERALDKGDFEAARKIASLPDQIRGYEEIKLASIREAKKSAEDV